MRGGPHERHVPSIGIRASVDQVYTALTTVEGIGGWWSNTTGAATEGERFTVHFGEKYGDSSFTVAKAVPGELARWTPIADKGNEWRDTTVEFALRSDGDQVFVDFRHDDWAEVSNLFRLCSMKWAVFLLKDYVETGEGRPVPNDIPINHL
ncbi:SRPBCC domain-containing protein [Myxococcota bacterium]